MVELECKAVEFYSPQDEAAFFAWARSLPEVEGASGRGHCIIITVRSKRVSNASLRELISLFRRYRVSMRQLAQFRNASNEAWLTSPEAHWFKRVFGGGANGQMRRPRK